MGAGARQHSWIYAVLIEMNEYCRNEGLDEVSAKLRDAIAEIEPVIFAPVSPGALKVPPSSQAEVLPFRLTAAHRIKDSGLA